MGIIYGIMLQIMSTNQIHSDPPEPESKLARSRARMRAAGLRPVQFWVPDTRLASFAEQIRTQCLALKGDGAEVNALEFTTSAAEFTEGWK